MKNLTIKILLIFCALFMISAPAFSDGYVNKNEYKVEDLISFRLLTDKFQSDFDQKRGTKEAEDAYLDILDYYYDFVDKQNKNIPIYKLFNSVDDEFLKYKYSLYYFGLILWFDEGSCYFVRSNKYIYENFAPYLSKEWQELLKFSEFFDDCTASHARFNLSKSELKNIIEFYKNFSKKYPEFSKKREIKKIIKGFEKDLKHYYR